MGKAKKAPPPSRSEEVEDEAELLDKKCQKLANFIKSANNCMIYTGAGISTAASIPDYRGPNGVWTLAGKGIQPAKVCNPIDAEPTDCHMALRELYKRGYVRHILSQNCDGLHLRSGLPQTSLSEVHGNMFIEVCSRCVPLRQYIRDFDVTAATRFRRHGTERRCDTCRAPLRDTIVHFGEWGRLAWPLNWAGSTELVKRMGAKDLIVCLGTSLQILNKYPFLWADDRPPKDRPKLVIVNLQWTPKDRGATLKISGRCDYVMRKAMELLQLPIPYYCRTCDPVLGGRRRSGRNKDMVDKMSECGCAFPCNSDSTPSTSRNSPAADDVTTTPGWWTAGLAALTSAKKRPSTDAAAVAKGGKRKRGRPPKARPTAQDDDSDDEIPLAALRKAPTPNRQKSESSEPYESSLLDVAELKPLPVMKPESIAASPESVDVKSEPVDAKPASEDTKPCPLSPNRIPVPLPASEEETLDKPPSAAPPVHIIMS